MNAAPCIRLIGLGSLLFLLPSLSALAEAETDSLHHVKPEACKQCHEEIYTQWKRSMHANSSALKDPIHGAFYRT